MRSLIFANLYTRKPADSATATSFAFPKIIAGQQWTLGFRFSDRANGVTEEIFPAIVSLKAAVGVVDARPASGTVKWQVGEGVSTGANTTAAFDWNDSAHEIEGQLNELPGFDGANFTVVESAGSYLVSRANGAQVKITLRSNQLNPVSGIPERMSQKDGVWITEVRYTQLPITFSESAEPVLPSKPYMETVVDGYTSMDGTYKTNEVQRLVVPPDFRGQYALKRGFNQSQLLSIDDGVEQIQTTYNALLALEGGSVAATDPDVGVVRMVYGGALSGVDVEEPEIVVPVEGTPPGDWTTTIDFKRPEVYEALREKGGEITLPFSLEIEVLKDAANPDAGTKVIKCWQEPITIAPPLTWDGLELAQNLEWLQPPSPKDYRRFSLNTIITGQQHYVTPFGDGEETEFVFIHNLGTADYSGLEVIDNTTGRFLERDVEYSITASTESTLTVTLPEAPSEGGLYVVITTAGPVSAFIAGLQIEIDQVNGLPLIVETLGSRIQTLESIFPTSNPGIIAGNSTGRVTVIPIKKALLFWRGDATVYTENGPDISKLGNPKAAPLLLPAIHDAVIDELPYPLPVPEGNAGKVWVNESDDVVRIVVPGMGGFDVQPGGFVGCDGNRVYPVSPFLDTNTYYPTPFEVTFLRYACNGRMLGLNQSVETQFGLKLQLLHADAEVQWQLVVDIGVPSAETEPDPVGTNLKDIIWSDTPVLIEPIFVGPLLDTHYFGVSIRREAGGMKLSTMIYGKWGNADELAPESPYFVLRVRLGPFDTVDNVSKAKGWLYYEMTGVETTDAEGNKEAKPAQVVIA